MKNRAQTGSILRIVGHALAELTQLAQDAPDDERALLRTAQRALDELADLNRHREIKGQ